MGDIVLLDDLTINKIAAGEVVERPANVVKELVENSADAGAKKITIEIKKGGKSLIKVSDDGKGIDFDDIPVSIERHATSKIKKIEDLENTYTMGFRGEALASISAISRMTILTKMRKNNTGAKVVVEAGNIVEADEVGISDGTTVIVENIFFNTPVRYKFLKNDSTEYRYIKEFVERFCLANPEISIKLINDGKTIISTNGSGNIQDVVYLLYGKEIKENIVNVDYSEDDIKVSGVVRKFLFGKG